MVGRELGYPALSELCRDGSPSYAENDVDGDVWSPARVPLRVRALRFAIPAR